MDNGTLIVVSWLRMAIPFLACMLLTASVYHLPPRVLPSILAVEGGKVGLVHLNKDQSEDLGVMQINTLWIDPLGRRAGLPPAEVRDRLINDSCFNIAAAGLIMRTYLDETKGDLMRAVGDYNSHTPLHNQNYQVKVMDAARIIFYSKQ
jgi:hypothetical protein